MARSRPMTPAQDRRWRFYAESPIEKAISILDAIDGDPDFEDGGVGGPSLASPVGGDSRCAGAPVATLTGSNLFGWRLAASLCLYRHTMHPSERRSSAKPKLPFIVRSSPVQPRPRPICFTGWARGAKQRASDSGELGRNPSQVLAQCLVLIRGDEI